MSEHWMATDSVGFAKAVELLRALTVADAEDGEETDEGDVDDRAQVLACYRIIERRTGLHLHR